MPRSPETHSQKSAPGPPSTIAVATPAMFPTPTVDASAVATAPNGETFPSPVAGFVIFPRTSFRAVPMCRNCTAPVRIVRRRPVPINRMSIGGPHTSPLSQLFACVIVSVIWVSAKEDWGSLAGLANPTYCAHPRSYATGFQLCFNRDLSRHLVLLCDYARLLF